MILFHTAQADSDGYEDLKFGMSEEEILEKKVCTYKKVKDSFVTVYTCKDFLFYGDNTTANFDFINNNLSKISITISEESSLKRTGDELKNKYGEASSKSSKEEMEIFYKEGGTVYGSYNNDTITLSVTLDAKKQTFGAILVYLSKDLESLKDKIKKTAIDGYEDLKFGMSEEEILAKEACSLKLSNISEATPFEKEYTCRDFQLYGVKQEANFYFINNKFLKLLIPGISEDLAIKIVNGLYKKHGDPSTMPSQEYIDKFNQSRKPGDYLLLKFRNDTVRFYSYVNYSESKIVASISYLSKDFKSLIEKPMKTPVDGYKDLKFGMSEEEILAKRICTTEKVDISDINSFAVAHMCEDFKFAGAKTAAYFYFIDNRFLKFVIANIPGNLMSKIGVGLGKKYGKPTSKTKEKEIEKLLSTGGSLQVAAFANDTISTIINVPKDNPDDFKLRLDYVSADFERLKDEKMEDSLEDDL